MLLGKENRHQTSMDVKENKALYTATFFAGGWAGAVMNWAGVEMSWAGAVMIRIVV